MKKKLKYESFSSKVAKQISVSKESATLVASQIPFLYKYSGG